jgi:hypothetical protein
MSYPLNIAVLLQRGGPYLLLELLLPGGTLFALLLFLYRRWRRDADRAASARATAVVPSAYVTARRAPVLRPAA